MGGAGGPLADFWRDVDQWSRDDYRDPRSPRGRRFRAAPRGASRGEGQGAHISFDSVDLLWNTLTRKRWEILRAMTGQGGLSIREAARRVGRDVKAVGDETALLHGPHPRSGGGGRGVFL
jgi:hypothetical protein